MFWIWHATCGAGGGLLGVKGLLASWVMGWLLAMAGAGHGGGCAYGDRAAGNAVWVVADRSRNQLVWLDRDLIVTGRWSVPCPVAIAWGDGRLWVASAVEGRGDGAHRLHCLDRHGRLRGTWFTGPVLGLASRPGGIYLLGRSGPGSELLWFFTSNGIRMGRIRTPGAKLIKESATGIWILGAPGKVTWIPDGSTKSPEITATPAHIQSQRGVQTRGMELWCRGPAKASKWYRFTVGGSGWGEARERPWLPPALDGHWPSGPRERRPPALVAWMDAQAIIPDMHGSWLVRGTDYLWRMDRHGIPLVGQGGFGFLTGAARLDMPSGGAKTAD